MSIGVDGKPRHLLGIRFWDLVRIRGQRTGAKYPFTYASGGSGNGGASEAAEAMERQNPTAQQTVDANREAVITHQEEPPAKEARKDDYKSEYDSGSVHYTRKQESDIDNWGANLLERYSVGSPADREFDAAIEQGYGAVLAVAKRYKLQ
jgi:hypothetical protein